MSTGVAIYLAGAVFVGGFFLGALMSKPETSNQEAASAIVLGLIWPMTLAGVAWMAVFKWAERQKK